MTGLLDGIDEIRKADGTDLLLGIGFGLQTDWEIIDRQEVDAVASVDVLWQDAVYEQVEVYWYLAVTTDDVELNMRVSEDGSTFVNSAAAYSFELAGDQNNAGDSFETEGDSTTEWQLILNQGNDADEFSSGTVLLGACDDATRLTSMNVRAGYISGIPREVVVHGAGQRNAAAVLRGIQMIPSGGNLTGTVVVRGRRKVPIALTGQSDWEVIEQRLDISASSNEDFFWSDQVYDEIEVTLTGYIPSADDTDLDLTLSTDGSTFHTTAGDYQWAYHGGQQAATAVLGGSDSDVRIKAIPGGGTGTDEHVDLTIHITNVSNTTRKGMLRYIFVGKLATLGTFIHANAGAILLADNGSIRGFSLDSAGATTFSADSITVRGRRLSPQIGQGDGGGGGGGDFVHMGTFTNGGAGATLIDVDFRSSVNPQFADFTNTDFMVSISGLIGPGNNQLEWRVLRAGVQQGAGNDYKDDGSSGRSAIRLSHGTAGSGRRIQTRFIMARGNNLVNDAVRIVGESFSASSSGAILVGTIGGHNNGLGNGINDGFRVFATNDLDDITVDVWAMKKSG